MLKNRYVRFPCINLKQFMAVHERSLALQPRSNAKKLGARLNFTFKSRTRSSNRAPFASPSPSLARPHSSANTSTVLWGQQLFVVLNDPRMSTASTAVKCPLPHNSSFCELARFPLRARNALCPLSQLPTLLILLLMISYASVLCDGWAYQPATRCAIRMLRCLVQCYASATQCYVCYRDSSHHTTST